MRLELHNIKKIYGTKTALDIDKLEFENGKIYAILGTNGSGKTTMLRIIAGVDRADSGHIYYNGSETHQGDSEPSNCFVTGTTSSPVEIIPTRSFLFTDISETPIAARIPIS